MGEDGEILFGPFRLDCNNQQLWRSEQQLALQPKPLAVLQYLAQHAGRLITKEELLQQVWVGTHVTPKALTVCIHAIRAILGDSGATPQFIATQGKQGYRFLAPLAATTQVPSSKFQVPSSKLQGLSSESKSQGQQLTTGHWQLTPHLVGREKNLPN
jgi:DNA-binding winged helix-turn-helix (wHTH) protein